MYLSVLTTYLNISRISSEVLFLFQSPKVLPVTSSTLSQAV
nr:MAG TPA: hypothetical protein [Bacteriophage sp.]